MIECLGFQRVDPLPFLFFARHNTKSLSNAGVTTLQPNFLLRL